MSRSAALVGVVIVALAAGLLPAATAWAQEDTPLHQAEAECLEKVIRQTTCPVMGGKVNEDISAEHEGRRVYFCCAGCVEKFKEDPEKYLAELDERLLQRMARCLPQQQCPVMGGQVDPDVYADHEGRRVYFCCEACPAKFSRDPGRYLRKLDEELSRRLLRSVPQEKCPVTGRGINEDISVEHDGRRVYFCCQGCPEQFNQSPEKYVQKLDEQARQRLLKCALSGNCPTWQPAEEGAGAGKLTCEGCPWAE